jgi:RES domain
MSPGGVVAHPRRAWTILNVTVQLQTVVDLTDTGAQTTLATTAQELTGDWRGYHFRSPSTSIPLPVAPAPTQELGAALHDVDLEGFLTISAKLSDQKNLVIFPQNMRRGSFVEFSHPTLGSYRINGSR